MPITSVVKERLNAWNEASMAFVPVLRGEPGDSAGGAMVVSATGKGAQCRSSLTRGGRGDFALVQSGTHRVIDGQS
ncbi:hypothetical protein PQU92_10595 [Asticcacaulis sp. BYS171W]|uniref:Uncharacterized protein n=1 Tax=Asticcacaulis aquaticus TaxID=2984212 RepID=A0ABT5HUI5_9CAUL|nr:hypothetical protein [Asticcacaulis aquaticus]